MTARQRQAFPAQTGLNPTFYSQAESRNLRNPSRLYDRRAALALRKACGFVLIGVDAPELFSIGIVDTDKEMVMFAAAILPKGTLASSRAFFRYIFCHVNHPI
jgi:hypothetical protein